MAAEWKRILLRPEDNADQNDESHRNKNRATHDAMACVPYLQSKCGTENSKQGGEKDIRSERLAGTEQGKYFRNLTVSPASGYLIACREEDVEEYRKQLLYDMLGPIFFGEKQADSREELAELFRSRYGIDVMHDFCEGDEHYEEYQEAQQAIAEGMSIYGGSILFGDSVLAELAGEVWENLERRDKKKFRRINTMLEE